MVVEIVEGGVLLQWWCLMVVMAYVVVMVSVKVVAIGAVVVA